jgi:hypothetical protein
MIDDQPLSRNRNNKGEPLISLSLNPLELNSAALAAMKIAVYRTLSGRFPQSKIF